MPVLVLGSTNADLVVSCARFPAPGETLLGGRFAVHPGGKGANQAVAAARLSAPGTDVRFVTKVGRDGFGESAKAQYAAEGLPPEYVLADAEAATGVALITVVEGGENSIVVASGANATLSVDDLDTVSTAFTFGKRSAGAKTRVALFQLETPLPTVTAAVAKARAAGATVVLNPAPASALPDALLAQVDVLTPNETEAAALTGLPTDTDAGIEAAAEALLRRGVGAALLTLGARGVYLRTADAAEYIPAPAAAAVDTTAAGDCFNGALAVALAEGRSLPEATAFACRAAALSVTRAGAQPSLPGRNEVEGA